MKRYPVIDVGYLRDVELGRPRFVWVGRTLWIRTYREGGYDGYRTIWGRRDVCDNIARALRHQLKREQRDQIADAFGVPSWLAPLPGEPLVVPRRVRAARWLRHHLRGDR